MLGFIIGTNSAFRLVENEKFHELISYVSNGQAKVPTTKTLITDLNDKYIKIKLKLMELIDRANYVCLTADGWTNKGRSFLGITIHMFDDNLNKESYLLAFRRLFGRHTFDALKDSLLSVINEFKIKVSKITHIVTDGASNFKKAFKVYGPNGVPSTNQSGDLDFDVDGQCDVEDETIDLELFVSDSVDIFVPPETETIDIDLNQSDQSPIDEEYEYADDRLPDQLICYSHSINRVGIDFENELSETEKRASDALKGAYSKLCKFWQLNSRSTVAHEIVERVCKRSFPYPSSTRWNSKFDSIELAEKHKSDINEAIDEINSEAKQNAKQGKKGKKLEKLSTREWNTLKDYALCMKSISMGLDILQGDKRACQGYILPVLYGIEAGLKDNVNNDLYTSEYGTIFHRVLLKCFRKRFADKMKICEENKNLILAAAIHPNFKLSWIHAESDREFVQSQLINSFIDLSRKFNNDSTLDNEVQNEQQDEKQSNENSFFKHIRSNVNLRRSSTEDSLTLDVFQYLVQPLADPSIHEFRVSPILQEMFRQFNTTLSSSAAIERIFSKALIIFTNRRNRISDANFEKALFVYHNEAILRRYVIQASRIILFNTDFLVDFVFFFRI